MSHMEEMELYDEAALGALVRGFRRAEGDRRAIEKLVRDARTPRPSRAQQAKLRADLDKLRSIEAPKIILASRVREVDPHAYLLDRLTWEEPIEEHEVHYLALREKRPFPPQHGFITWLADREARRAGPTPDMREGWIHGLSVTSPMVREALFGAETLVVDGIEIFAPDRAWVHATASLPAVRRFLEGLLHTAPPPLDEYQRWYPHLHAMRFSLSDEAAVPAEGPLAWDYAGALADAARAIRAMVSMLKRCEKRGWCVRVLSE